MRLLFAGDFIPTKEAEIDTDLKQTIRQVDYSFVNLETPLTNSEKPILKNGNNFMAAPRLISKVKEFGFDGVTLANNHIRDFGDLGVLDTIEACDKNDIIHAGAGKNIDEARKPLRLEKNGVKVSVINVAEKEFNIADENKAGANPYDTIDTYYQIREEKKWSDKVIVVYHGGVEYIKYPAPYIVKEFKFLIDVGADAVVSHHTHRYSGIIEYKNKPIAFGLGNFFSTSSVKNQPIDWYKGLLIDLDISQNRIGVNKIFPIQFDSNKKFIYLLKGFESDQIIEDVNNISSVLESPEELSEIWKEFLSENRQIMLALLKSSSKNEYRLRKRLPDVFSGISDYQRLNFLNIIKCEAHKNLYLELFKNNYD